jgi:endonuclease/exonuclease/phosphatase family metal-dependent hydrolase
MKCLLLITFLSILSISLAETQRFSILSYTIYHGENPTIFERPTLDTIADYIVLVQPEAIAFQELDSMTLRSTRIYGEKIKQIARLSRKTGYRGYFGRAIEFEAGAYGNGILNKKSRGYHALPLSSPAGGEARAVVWSQLELKTLEKLYMGSVHLDHECEENRIA